jgi:hypothetical protein
MNYIDFSKYLRVVGGMRFSERAIFSVLSFELTTSGPLKQF